MKTSIFILLSIVLICGSCSISKRVQAHEQQLQMAINSDLNPPEKFDLLAESLVKMMHQSLDFANPKKGVKFVKAYGETNKTYVDQLFKDFNDYQQNFSTVERIAFGARLVSKPYFRDLIDLVPRFHRKYKQIKFVTDVNKKLKESAKDWLGSKLPD